MTITSKAVTLAGVFAVSMAATSAHAVVVFDNVSPFENGVAGASATSTGSTPNTFMGDGYTLLTGTTSITGFDVFPVNLTGTNFTSLKLNIYVWGTVNTGTVSATTPAFGNLLGSYSVTSSGGYPSGYYYSFESSTPGVTPGIALGAALALPGPTVGITINAQGSTDGVTFANANSLTSLISYGAAPTVGTALFNGYYRNANSETNGNFTSTLRSLGYTNQSLALRVYGNAATVAAVPEPATYLGLAMGLGLMALTARGRRKTD